MQLENGEIMMELEGRVALVTGGGRGIGRGIVRRFLQEGARVAVVQRSVPDDELLGTEGVVHIPADLRDLDSLERAVDGTVAHFGRLDILVNNAGVMIERDIGQLTAADWESMADINLRAPVFLIRVAVEHMRAQGGGSIISIGSVEATAANPQHALYSATKAGVEGLMRALAVDLGPDGIRCNTIAPGWITSDLSEAYLASLSDDGSAEQELIDLHPAGRLGTPEDIGDVAVHLASERSRFVTGQVHVVDGGRTIRLPTPGSAR